MSAPEFVSFPKIARFARACIVTEKIDGTNAQVHVTDAGEIFAGSRNQWVTPTADNFGFAKWVEAHRQELLALGPGSHFGEWWGAGIQRRYGLDHKRFSLFNVDRWGDASETLRPACCHVVPVLWRGKFEDLRVAEVVEALRGGGSVAAPGLMQPEGVVVFHTASRFSFKKTLEKDDEPKGGAR